MQKNKTKTDTDRDAVDGWSWLVSNSVGIIFYEINIITDNEVIEDHLFFWAYKMTKAL